MDQGDPHLKSLRSRRPGPELAAWIEDLFGVPPGFLTATPSGRRPAP
ncbi:MULTISPECIES: hypothetical protein [unclassified Streptomyces]